MKPKLTLIKRSGTKTESVKFYTYHFEYCSSEPGCVATVVMHYAYLHSSYEEQMELYTGLGFILEELL